MLDKTSYKLMKAMLKRDLSEDKINKILKRTDTNRPDKRLCQLKKYDMISVRRMDGIPDGEGGYLDETVNYYYHLEQNGRAEVERVRKSRLKWLIGTGIAFLAAIGAILSALSN